MRAVCSPGNKARPALPPAHPRLTSRLRLDALSGSGVRSEFLAQLAGGLLLFTATPPHAGARTLTRTHLEDSAFAPESGLGSGPTQPEGCWSPRVPAHAHTSNARGPPWCASLGRTPSLCHLRPGSPGRRARAASSLLRTRARGTLRRKVDVFVTPSAPPALSELAHVDTTHTECLARAILPPHLGHLLYVGAPPRAPLSAVGRAQNHWG